MWQMLDQWLAEVLNFVVLGQGGVFLSSLLIGFGFVLFLASAITLLVIAPILTVFKSLPAEIARLERRWWIGAVGLILSVFGFCWRIVFLSIEGLWWAEKLGMVLGVIAIWRIMTKNSPDRVGAVK